MGFGLEERGRLVRIGDACVWRSYRQYGGRGYDFTNVEIKGRLNDWNLMMTAHKYSLFCFPINQTKWRASVDC